METILFSARENRYRGYHLRFHKLKSTISIQSKRLQKGNIL